MIDIEELKRKALACQAFHAAGCPVDDPHDTYPPDHYDAAVQPKYILALIERLEAAERDLKQIKFAVHEFLGWPLVAEIVAEGDPSEDAATPKEKL